MKKLSTISLFIFGVVVMAILTAGLVFYQNNKDGVNSSGNLIKNTIDKINPNGGIVTLDMTEITKHNKSSNCWLLINGDVYNITSFFGSHPGGNSVMAATCGTDATDAYMTKDPNAKTASGGQDHSSRAREMLKDYYLGKLNEVIGTNNTKNNISSAGSATPTSSSNITSVKSNTVSNPNIVPAPSITLTLSEISKHNKSSDCFLLISGKIYNITSFFGSHPGGNSVMAATCGTDATDAYMTKDSNAKTASGGQSHSSNAQSMLASYYIGDLNQSIGSQKITNTNNVVAPKTKGGDDEWDD